MDYFRFTARKQPTNGILPVMCVITPIGAGPATHITNPVAPPMHSITTRRTEFNLLPSCSLCTCLRRVRSRGARSAKPTPLQLLTLPRDGILTPPLSPPFPALIKPLRKRRPFTFNKTDRAAAHLKSLVESKPGKVGVRLGVKRRGCNGMSYTLKYADEKPKGDEEVVVQAIPSSATESAAPRHAADGYPGPGAGASGGGDGGGVAINGQSRRGEEAAGEQERNAADAVAGGSDVRLFVDPMATLYIAGTVMDWEETELSSEFTFTNPNAKGECGCGESFNV